MSQSRIILVATVSGLIHAAALPATIDTSVWDEKDPKAEIVVPDKDQRSSRLVQTTFERFLGEFYGVKLSTNTKASRAGLNIVAGTPGNNSVLSDLVRTGVKLTDDLAEEGFQLLSHADTNGRYVIIYGKTPRALKHGVQELIFYRLAATTRGGQVDWPLDVIMQPEFSYRGVYMLPCWSQHDSIQSWRRVLKFNSELTLNRNWFWLDGFPVAGHRATSHVPGKPSDYDRTPLASNENVQSLIDLVNNEDMKFYIGGGWMSWHHQQHVGKDPHKGRDFYLAYLRHFKGVSGFYFEPTGEGSEVEDWRPEAESLRDFIRDLTARHPAFEVAVAIGKFNNPEYLKMMSEFNPRRVYWWWCWGDPHADNPFAYYPSVLGWHTTVRMSAIHGTTEAPSATDRRLAGFATSYDPGMGYGNPWNGGSTLGGAPGPRDFHPYTMPYFSHQYWFRERCWNVDITREAFARRLGRRLFDADMPPESIELYLTLANLCSTPGRANAAFLARIDEFVRDHSAHGTPRNRDTLERMHEAVAGMREYLARQVAAEKEKVPPRPAKEGSNDE